MINRGMIGELFTIVGSGVGIVSSTPLPLNLWQSGATFYAKDTTKPMYNAGTGAGVIQIYNNNNLKMMRPLYLIFIIECAFSTFNL
jgi:hypothetical protein